jgi:hypothetical protein
LVQLKLLRECDIVTRLVSNASQHQLKQAAARSGLDSTGDKNAIAIRLASRAPSEAQRLMQNSPKVFQCTDYGAEIVECFFSKLNEKRGLRFRRMIFMSVRRAQRVLELVAVGAAGSIVGNRFDHIIGETVNRMSTEAGFLDGLLDGSAVYEILGTAST